MFRHLKRALADNLQQVVVVPREADRLARRGVRHAILQRYLAWRRSVFLFMIPILLASAVGNTLNDLRLPASEWHMPFFKHTSLPLPATQFSRLANQVMGVLNYALPLAALGAAAAWKHWRRSRRFLLAGWLAGFLVPMLLAITPLSWWLPDDTHPAVEMLYGVVYGLTWFVLLLPTILSLLPGMVRACLRLKTLLPESIIPGWILVAAAPVYSLLLLLGWVAFCHLASNLLLVGGMLFWIAAPLVYVVWARTLTGPLVTEREQRRFRRVHLAANGLSALSMLLLIAFVFTEAVGDFHLVGLDPNHSLIRPWEVAQYLAEYFGRSLFITVMAADFFMRVNGSIWHAAGRFAGTPAAEEYDRLMQELRHAD